MMNARVIVAGLMLSGCAPAFGQTAQRIPDSPVIATEIVDVAGKVWLATPKGAYRVDGDTATKFPAADTNVTAVCEVNGTTWLAATDGAYRVDGDHAVRVPSTPMVVTKVVAAGGAVWFATPKGAFRLVGDPMGDPSGVSLRRVPDKDIDAMSIETVGNDVWLAMFGGAYHVTGDTAQRFPTLKYALNQIVDVGGHAWLATDEGPFISDGVTAKPVAGVPTEVFHINQFHGETWMVGRDGAYRADGDSGHRIPDRKLDVTSITYAGGHAWVSSRTGAYRIDGNHATRIPDRDLDVAQVSDVVSGGKHVAWIAAKDGAYRVEGDRAIPVSNLKISVRQIVGQGGQPWLATDAGAFVVRNGVAVREPDSEATVLSMRNVGGDLWMTTTNGTFRVRSSGPGQFSLEPAATNWTQSLERFLPPNVRFSGEYRIVSDSGDDTTKAIVAVGEPAYQSALNVGQARDLKDITVNIGPGKQTVYVGIQGRWSSGQYKLSGTFIPAGVVLVGFGLLGWWLIHLLVLATASYNRMSWTLLMSQAWRDYASFGLTPALIRMIPAVRKSLLRRYRADLQTLPAFASAGTDPQDMAIFVPKDIQDHLAADRVVALSAPSAIDMTGYLQYLAGCYATARPGGASATGTGLRPAGVLPVLLSPSDESLPAERQVLEQVMTRGRITDAALARDLTEREPLLLLVASGGDSTWFGDMNLYIHRGRARYLCAVWDLELEGNFRNSIELIELGMPESVDTSV